MPKPGSDEPRTSAPRGVNVVGCSSFGSSSTTTSVAARISSAIPSRERHFSSIRPSRSSPCSRRRRNRRFASSGRSRRTRTQTMSRATAASRSSTASPSRSIRSLRRSTRTTRSPTTRSSRGVGAGTRAPHARAPPRALRAPRRRAAPPDRRLALRRRRGTARPRGRGARGRTRPLRVAPASRALGDEVEVYPGHVAGSLCGTAMSSDQSTTIGRERATNTMLSFGDVAGVRPAVGARVTAPRPPTTERVVALNRGPWVGAPGAARRARRPGRRRRARRAAGAGLRRRPLPGRAQRPGRRRLVRRRRQRSSSTRTSRSCCTPRRRRRRRPRRGGCGRSGSSSSPDSSLEPHATEPLATLDVDELRRLAAGRTEAVQIVDVRESSERDAGYVPGVAQHPVPAPAQRRRGRARPRRGRS